MEERRGSGQGRDVDALGVGCSGSGLEVGDERHGPARVVEQLARDVVLLELGEEFDELGQRGRGS